MPGPRGKVIPTKEQLLEVYPQLNLLDAAARFGVGQTLFLKWLLHHEIPRTKGPRQPRSEEHKRKLGLAHSGVSQRRAENYSTCPSCGKEVYRRPSSRKVVLGNFCSQACANLAKRAIFPSKVCTKCGNVFCRTDGQSSQNFARQVYCSVQCARQAHPPPTFFGEENANWKGNAARRRHRHGPTERWRRAVLARDNATCQQCGETEGTLVVHHVKAFETHPELRFEASNGLTLCQPCHFQVHGYNLRQPGIQEQIDDRGVLHRRWIGKCLCCGALVVRRASDMVNPEGLQRQYAFCSKMCSSRKMQEVRATFPGQRPKDVFEILARRLLDE